MKFRIVLVLILLAFGSRLLPHPPNFTPIAAIGLLGAAYMDKKWLAFLVPFAGLFLSDLVLNNTLFANENGFTWFTSIWIYAAFALVIAAGMIIFRKRTTPVNILGASLASSTIFFVVTNIWAWQSIPMYPKTFAGLLSCYTMGLPYFGWTLLGDLFYSAVLFGAYALAANRYIPVKA